MFTDDTMFYLSGKDLAKITGKMDEDLLSLLSYLKSNSMYINVSKYT